MQASLSNKQSGNLVQIVLMMLSQTPSDTQHTANVFRASCPVKTDLFIVFIDHTEVSCLLTGFSSHIYLGENRLLYQPSMYTLAIKSPLASEFFGIYKPYFFKIHLLYHLKA